MNPRTLCENRGTGLATMLESLRRAGMSPPEFDVSLTRFRLAFPNHTMFDQETLTWLEQVAQDRPLHERQRQALAWLRHGKELSNAIYCRLTGADSRVATRELTELVEMGVLQREGTRRWATYSLTREPAVQERAAESPQFATSERALPRKHDLFRVNLRQPGVIYAWQMMQVTSLPEGPQGAAWL